MASLLTGKAQCTGLSLPPDTNLPDSSSFRYAGGEAFLSAAKHARNIAMAIFQLSLVILGSFLEARPFCVV